MRAGLPQREPEILQRWERMDLYRLQRERAKGSRKSCLHDGPPYANGNIHIGTGLNKILKDVVVRSHQMLGFRFQLCPGMGLPRPSDRMEDRGRISRQGPRQGRRSDKRVPPRVPAMRRHWMGVQTDEFKRLGEGDFKRPYTTMRLDAEAIIAAELMKFAVSGRFTVARSR